jgi:pantetheine-phosphate adenylyltransferase
MRVCIGGTFDRFHKGHKALINKAFKLAGKNGFVFIGLTKGNIARNKKDIKKFEERKKLIEQYITNSKFSSNYEIQPISDKYGPTLDDDFDAIVVSPETKKTALEINEERKKKSKKIIKIVEVTFVLAEDNKPISSTRIRNKEIDEDGNIL